jgi:hypothetical protein
MISLPVKAAGFYEDFQDFSPSQKTAPTSNADAAYQQCIQKGWYTPAWLRLLDMCAKQVCLPQFVSFLCSQF